MLIAYLAYTLSRLIFLIANLDYFDGISFLNWIVVYIHGLRFDSFSIVVGSSIFILLSILPLNYFYKNWYQRILKSFFILGNCLFLLFNFIDVGYYKFIKKRSTADLFNQIGGQTDMQKLLPQYLEDFWWILLLYILILILIFKLYKKISLETRTYKFVLTKNSLLILLCFTLSAGIGVFAVRGGWQRSPISFIDVGLADVSKANEVILNTPFTIIKSFEMQELKRLNYFNEKELLATYNPNKHYKNLQFTKKNVVVILLESFAKEYTSLGKTGKSYTPFLDSLMQHGLVFNNAFSNGTKSIEGIPAVLSSLPSLMSDPVINSPYAIYQQTSFANILAAEGYETAFMHGGINGTMNFNVWAKQAGYKNYFGKNEYNNDSDFDGFWGIWDEPYLQYSIKKMDAMQQPFHTAIFTLSSHHPFNVPLKYKNKFKKGEYENAECIGYADYALKQFFESAKKSHWFENTLFVLTADHASLSGHNFYKNQIGNFTIPIFFYEANNSLKGVYGKIFSQIDILPTALEYLGYNKSFFSFGNSALSSKTNYCTYYFSDTYYNLSDSLAIVWQPNSKPNVINYYRDSALNMRIPLNSEAENSQFKYLKAMAQTYNNTLIGGGAQK